jgi:hypothetical protein
VQDTEASKQALKEAELAEHEKHAKWLEAEKAGQQADKFAADKLAKVESALNSQMASLTTESKVSFSLNIMLSCFRTYGLQLMVCVSVSASFNSVRWQ